MRVRPTPDCLSDLTLDRLLAGELELAERSVAKTHLAQCGACEAARARFAVEQQDFSSDTRVPTWAAAALMRAQNTKPTAARGWTFAWPRRLVFGVGLTAGLAAAALWMGRSPVEEQSPTSRIKGGFALEMFVKHQERNTAGAAYMGEPLHPSDQIQFRVSLPKAAFLAILAVDADAKISVYFPAGPTAEKIAAGRERDLATAVELDGTLGIETIVAVGCDEALPVSGIVAATRRAIAAARSRNQPPTALGALDLPCMELRQDVEKSARPGLP